MIRDVLAVGAQPVAADLKGSQTLLQSLFKCSADGHGFPHGFHGCREIVRCFGEFFKAPARYFYHTVIQGRLERCQGFSGNVVGDFIKCISDGKLGCDLGNGKARGFGSKGRASGYPGIHLNYDQFSVFGVHGELNI